MWRHVLSPWSHCDLPHSRRRLLHVQRLAAIPNGGEEGLAVEGVRLWASGACCVAGAHARRGRQALTVTGPLPAASAGGAAASPPTGTADMALPRRGTKHTLPNSTVTRCAQLAVQARVSAVQLCAAPACVRGGLVVPAWLDCTAVTSLPTPRVPRQASPGHPRVLTDTCTPRGESVGPCRGVPRAATSSAAFAQLPQPHHHGWWRWYVAAAPLLCYRRRPTQIRAHTYPQVASMLGNRRMSGPGRACKWTNTAG